MMNFFKRWKRNKKTDAPTDDKPIAIFNITVYPDKTHVEMFGDKEKIGGALESLMLGNPIAHNMILKSVISVNEKIEEMEAYRRLMAINLN